MKEYKGGSVFEIPLSLHCWKGADILLHTTFMITLVSFLFSVRCFTNMVVVVVVVSSERFVDHM